MAVPRIAIVGRPNVGKSSIFNWLAGRRLAIVEDFAGVTRDRLNTMLEHNDRHFELIDTGGIGIEDVDNLTEQVEGQILAAIEEADVLLFVVDSRTGLVPLDSEVADRLRKVNKPILLLANKTDSPSIDSNADEFHQLGYKNLMRISVLQNRNKSDLLDWIVGHLPDFDADPGEIEPPTMKVAIVGRRNVGKSTFVNTLVKEDRCIVSEVPGTTRDSVDVMFELDGYKFMAIDTPGLRRNKSIRTDIDWYGLHRAQRSVRRADVVLLFFDCTEPMSKVDKQLAHYIHDEFKPCIFVVNKWDKLAGFIPTERWVEYIREHFPTMAYCPIAFVTGQTGKNVKTLLNHAQMLFKQAKERISTSMLNKLVKAALERHEPPLYQLKRPKIYYATQVASEPPTIILVCNQSQGFSNQYRRYLLNFLRDHLPFGEIPIKLYLQPRKRDDQRDEIQGEGTAVAPRGKPGEQWEGAFEDEDLASLGKTGFEDVDLEESDDEEYEEDEYEEDENEEDLDEQELDDEEQELDEQDLEVDDQDSDDQDSEDQDSEDQEEEYEEDDEDYEEDYLDAGPFDLKSIDSEEGSSDIQDAGEGTEKPKGGKGSGGVDKPRSGTSEEK
jgi:GTP-binding protein